MIIADAMITNIVYKLICGVRTSITPTNISQRNPKITNRMITDVFILTAKLVILSFTCKCKETYNVSLKKNFTYSDEHIFAWIVLLLEI